MIERDRPMNELAALVLRRLEDLGTPDSPMSIRQATQRARGLTSFETLRKIVRGEHSGRISDETAEGIALALEIPVKEVYDAARVPRPQTRWNWPAKFDRLDLPQRRLVEDVAASLLEAYEKGVRDAR